MGGEDLEGLNLSFNKKIQINLLQSINGKSLLIGNQTPFNKS